VLRATLEISNKPHLTSGRPPIKSPLLCGPLSKLNFIVVYKLKDGEIEVYITAYFIFFYFRWPPFAWGAPSHKR
jgi:hypothetical protein